MSINFEQCDFNAAQREWLKEDIFVHTVNTISEAIKNIFIKDYLLVVLCSGQHEFMPYLQVIREIKPIPVVVMSPQYKKKEHETALRLGAEAYLTQTNPVAQNVASSLHVIRQHTKLEAHQPHSETIYSQRGLFVCVEHHKVFVHGVPIKLTHSDFKVLCLLLSRIGWAFSYEQIYNHVYGSETVAENTANAIQCQIKRIRRKLRVPPNPTNYIESVRGIGYRIFDE